jgi:NAD(P)H-dependent FMN reductase
VIPLLLVCGSAATTSANRAALDVVAARWRDRGLGPVTVVADLRDIPPFDPADVDAPAPSVAALRAAIAAAAVVVVAGPEYAGGLSGTTKNALDWIVGSGEFPLKPVGVLSAGSTGSVHARHQLVRTLTWQGAHVVADLGIAAPLTKVDADGRFVDPPTLTALREFADRVATLADAPAADREAVARQVVEAAGVDPRHVIPGS